jgi:hypothetical protein
MLIIISTAIVVGAILAVVLRFTGAFLRNPELSESAFPLGALSALLTGIGGAVLMKVLGQPSWLFIFVPIATAVFVAALGGAVFCIYTIFSWLTTGVDALANRGRELTDDFHFHRNLDRE